MEILGLDTLIRFFRIDSLF
jgi:hypothetical protein